MDGLKHIEIPLITSMFNDSTMKKPRMNNAYQTLSLKTNVLQAETPIMELPGFLPTHCTKQSCSKPAIFAGLCSSNFQFLPYSPSLLATHSFAGLRPIPNNNTTH